MAKSPRTTRMQRVERELYQMVSRYLIHGLSEPLACMASVSAVEVSPDLRNARVFFRLVGDEGSVKASEAILDSERFAIQREVAHSLKLKFCPVLRFEYGVAPHFDEIDALLAGIRR